MLINIDFNRTLSLFSHYSDRSLAELQQKFSMDDAFCLHEKGLLSDKDFALHINQSLKINLSFEEFLESWCALLIDIKPQIIDLLHSLKMNNHRLAMLSNTNHAHTLYWKKAFSELLPFFDKIFLSHEMGMRKPDAEIYLKVLEVMQHPKENALFFDDNKNNIDAAWHIGLPSLHIERHEQLTKYFKAKGLLP